MSLALRLAVTLFLLTGFSANAAGQHVEWYMQGYPRAIQYLARIGDLDGDGTEEWLLGVDALFKVNNRTVLTRQIWALSPAIRRWWPVFTYDNLRGDYEGLPIEHGDIDGDGFREFILSNRCFHGRTLTPMWRVSRHGPTQGDLDVNGDGHPDLVILDETPGSVALEAYNHLGQFLYRAPCPHPVVYWGRSLSKFIDYDGDGCDDILVGINTPPTYHGGCELISGRTGTVIFRIAANSPFVELNGTLKMVGDFDLDGMPDIGIGSFTSFAPGSVQIFSSRTQQRIHAWFGTSIDGLGISFDGTLDLDQDGVPDLIAPKPFELATGGGQRRGTINVYSGRDGSRIFYHQDWAVTNSGLGFWGAYPLAPAPGSVFPRFMTVLPNCCNSPIAYEETRIYMIEGGPDGANVISSGCSGGLLAEPRIGLSAPTTTTSRVTVSNAPPGALALLMLGVNTYSTPLQLGIYGMPGCTLVPEAIQIGAVVCGSTGLDAGYARHDFARRYANNSLSGMTVYGQWAVVDPAATWRAGMTKTLRWYLR